MDLVTVQGGLVPCLVRPLLTKNLLAAAETVRSPIPTMFTTQGTFILPGKFVEILNPSSKIASYRNGVYVEKENIQQ